MAEQVNYNKAFDQRLFGKETKKPAGTPTPKQSDEPPPPPPQDEKPKEKPQPQYKFLSVKIDTPSDGIKQDQPFTFHGEVQPLAGTINKTRFWIKAVAVYKGVKDVIAALQNDLNIDPKTNTFKGTVKACYFPDNFLGDNDKPADAKFELYLLVDGTGADAEHRGESIQLPMATKEIILKKGCYDRVAADKEPDKFPMDGENFIPDNKVWKLQIFLINARYLAQGSDTGYFNEKTDEAVKKFQADAKLKMRKKSGDGRILSLEPSQIKFNGGTDGIVGPKTESEIAVWTQYKYVKPDIELRKGDVDDHGVQNGHGKQNSDAHHKGSQVMDVQALLADVEAYFGSKDGWFWDRMEAAVKLFHEHAEKGQFLINGALTDIGEKLTGHRKGVVGQETVDFLKKVKERGGKVPGGGVVLADSVGEGGKNKPEDVKNVKQRLQGLGYPIAKIDGIIDDETLKSIKLFQIAFQVIETGEDTSNPTVVPFPDGLISKGKKTETNLFSDSPNKYEIPLKGTEKLISADCKKKIDSSAGENKKVWEKIVKIWKNVSPYLPSGSSMTSGYRSADEQRTLLYNFYNVKYKDKIIKKYSKDAWQKYYDLEGTNDADADAKILQMVRACGQKIASPGSSPHQKGIAIDIGGIGDQKQCRALLWCSVMQPGGVEITKILPEVNGCVHFEFKL